MSFFTLTIIKKDNAPSSATADSLQIGKVIEYKRSTFWNAFDLHELLHKIQNNEITMTEYSGSISKNVELSEIHCFLQCKNQENLVMFPRLSFDEKIYLKKKDEDNKEKEKKVSQKNQFTAQDNAWLKNQFQQWSFHEEGIISNHYFPQLCLCLDSSIELQLELQLVLRENNKKTIQPVALSGFAVTLKLRHLKEKASLWCFNSMGNIFNQTTGDKFVLTSMNVLQDKLDQCKSKGYLNEFKINCTNAAMLNQNHIFNIELIVLDKFGYNSWLESKLSTSQRWAIKQENMNTIGQWRHSKLATPEWHKLAYTWPVDEEEKSIDEFDWPVVGFLIPNAPPLRTIISSSFFDYPRLTLKVLKNGELNDVNAVSIMTPDVRFLMKEYANCTKMTIKQVEFNWFLDNCTSTLNLPFAGRRLFDQNGNEYFDLHSFKNIKVEGIKFYVTCGESWIDPRLCREEIETKTKLLRLIEDYKKLFHYCCLNSCKSCDLVIETFESLDDGSPLVISPCILSKDQRRRLDKGESIQAVIDHVDPNEIEDEQEEKKTAHQRSHDRISANKKVKWPWENIANKSMEMVVSKNEESVEVVQSINKSVQLKKPNNMRKLNLQKFTFNPSTGYIQSTDNSQLVFGVKSSEGNVNEVILMRRNDSDVNQRWMYKDNIIALKSRPHLVLTVQCASFEQILTNLKVDLENDKCIMELKEASFAKFLIEASSEVFTGSTVTLQRVVKCDAGGANQKWHYEEKSGFIFAFKSHDTDINITSAIQANLCTYNVSPHDISQLGYSCVLTTEDAHERIKKKKKTICLTCARDTRGKFKLTKLSDKLDFSCDANKDNTFHKLTGFRYLSNHHEMKIEQLFLKCRDDYILMTKKRPIVPAKVDERTEYLLKFLAHKNGEDHPNYFKSGEYIHGTNIKVVFDQATRKLSLSNAARKLFTIDGTPILDYQDLVNYCQLFYKKVIETMNERAKTISESRYLKIKQDKIYEYGPNLYELEELFDKDEIDNKALLKWPIHVWVSSGEAFINPSAAHKSQEMKKNHRKRIEEPGNKLDTQTHVLRNMTGRRYKAMEPGTLRPVQNPECPVVKEGHWSNVPYEEQLKQIEVEELKNEFDKLNAPTKDEQKISSSIVNKSLYDSSSKKKRVLIYANGETPDKAIKCWASSLDELIESSKIQLRLNKPVKFIYSQDGKIVLKLEDLEQDQLLCVSTGAQFIRPEDRNKQIESKANWSRVRRTEGESATHVQVLSSQNPIIDVDPFGPPLVATRNALTYPKEHDENHDTNENNYDSDSSSKRLKNLRFQHQNNKKSSNNESLLD